MHLPLGSEQLHGLTWSSWRRPKLWPISWAIVQPAINGRLFTSWKTKPFEHYNYRRNQPTCMLHLNQMFSSRADYLYWIASLLSIRYSLFHVTCLILRCAVSINHPPSSSSAVYLFSFSFLTYFSPYQSLEWNFLSVCDLPTSAMCLLWWPSFPTVCTAPSFRFACTK